MLFESGKLMESWRLVRSWMLMESGMLMGSWKLTELMRSKRSQAFEELMEID